MSEMRLSGLASGLDTNSLIQQLMRIERRPIDLIQNNIGKNNQVLEALRNLSTKFQALEAAAKKVQELPSFQPSASTNTKVADLSSTGIAGVGAIDTGATLGEYQVSVKSLATKQVIGGAASLDTNSEVVGWDDTSSEGVQRSRLLLLRDDGSELATITLNSGEKADIATIAQAFNGNPEASQYMTASVVGGQLVFTSKHAGEAFNYSLAVFDSPGGGGGASTDYNATATANLGLLNPTINIFGSDAAVVITKPDGSSVTQTNQSSLTIASSPTFVESSNTFAPDSANDLDFRIFANSVGDTSFHIRERDLSGSSSSNANDDNTTVGVIRDMITKYNDVVKQLKADTAYNPSARTGGPLMGDATIGRLQYELNTALTDPFTTYTATSPTGEDTGLNLIGAAGGPSAIHNNNNFTSYTRVGLRVEGDGTISIDETILREKLTSNPNDVRRLFAFEDYAFDAATNIQKISKGTNSTWGDGIATRLRAFANRHSSPLSPYNGVLADGQRTEGTILNRISAVNRQNTTLNDSIQRQERRLEQRERILRLQFQNMEKILSGLKSQGSYLQGQFSNLSGGAQ